jgi:purine-binding chemotaxis protein CheW
LARGSCRVAVTAIAKPERGSWLVVAVGSKRCAIPLAEVIETMRLLPIEPVRGMPPFVRGLSIIRGIATPVLDLGLAIGVHATDAAATRLVLLRVGTGERRIALALDAVVGVRQLDPAALAEMPPLLRGAGEDRIEAIGTLDAQLLVVLRGARLLADDAWAPFETAATDRWGSP